MLVSLQRLFEWSQVLFIIFPSPGRFFINRLPNLVVTGCSDKTFCFVELQALFIPFKAAKFDQGPTYGFLIIDEVLVVYVDHRD